MSHRLLAGTLVGMFLALLGAIAQEATDSPKAAETRKKLKQKVTVDYSNESLAAVVEDLQSQVKGLGVLIDSKGGVSNNLTITYKAADKPLEDVLAAICTSKGDLGYIVISKPNTAYDGLLQIVKGRQRGYAVGEEPIKTAKSKNGEQMDKDKPKSGSKKTIAKDKSETKDKQAGKGKAETQEKAEDDPDKAEQDAARKLKFAKTLAEDGKVERAKERLEDIISKFSKTKAAEEARELLKKLKDTELGS